jgi:hypothetical protein
MKIQQGGWAALASVGLALGCASESAPRWAKFVEVESHESGSELRALRSDRFEVYTSIQDSKRRVELVTALEAAFSAYCDFTGYTPPRDAPRMECYVFQTGAEWVKFTLAETGEMAPVYLQTRRGGYTFGKLFASRDAGVQDTLTVASHEGLHLFIATHFTARPPPFLEEGLACCFESVRRSDHRITINVGENYARQRRLALAVQEKKLQPLRKLLAMHAGQVVGLNVLEVETFYSQAWAFVRFLMEGEGGKYKPALLRLIADAQAGRLSSDELPDNPAMMERYLGTKLEALQPEYDRFVQSLAGKARLNGSE